MKVVILAGGYGSRFGKATEFVPKPMIQIGPHPMLWHIMNIYAHYGFNDFIICLGYKGDVIKEYFLNYKYYENDFTIDLSGRNATVLHKNNKGAASDWKVTLVDTELNTNTGGRIKRVEKYIDGDLFMATYGDGVSSIDLKKLVEFHRSHGKTATLTRVLPPSKFGNPIVEGNQVVRFIEKQKQSDAHINGGFYVFNTKVFDYLSPDESCILERDPLEKMAEDKQLMAYSHSGFWQCMDTLADMIYLNDLWTQNKAPWKLW